MIGWWVDVGYLPGYYQNPNPFNDFKNISECKVTDSRKPFTFGNRYSGPVNFSASQSLENRNKCAQEVISCIGDDYYTIYGIPGNSRRDAEEFEFLKEMVPSFELVYPNLYAIWREYDVDYPFFIKFLNSDLLILISRSLYYLYRIGKDGNSTYLGAYITDANLRWSWDIFYIIIADYKDAFNFTPYRLTISSYGSNLGPEAKTEQITKSSHVEFLQYILSSSAPDIENEIPPYGPGGDSGPTQPTNPDGPGYLPPGTFDDSSDAIPDSSLPTLSAANTGFTRIYNPTLAQVQDLARYLWTDETVVQTIWNHIKQYFEDPMQAIIGFNLVPCSVPNAGSQNFALMYIDTGVTMNVAANQFVDVDCGTVKLDRYYGSALDQSPYTRVSCYLPFIGTVRLNTDEVMETTLQVKYRIDICSGSCVAKILIDGNVLYQYSGHCAINIPFSSADFSSYVSSAISVARLAIGAGVAGAAGIAASSVSDPEQQTNRTVTVDRTTTTTERNPNTGRQVTSGTSRVFETRTYPVKQSNTQASFNALSPENISNTVGQIMSSKPVIEHSGSFSGNSGYLGVRRPYLLIERPNMCMPEQYPHFNGYPAMITMDLSTCKGFTRIHQVQLTGMSATNPEQAEILSLLKSGVYF